MQPALKLNAIEQEHLQELYNAAGVARDELPYTEQFEQLCRDFQDRTFKNATPEQVYAAVVRYVRSSTCAATPATPADLDAEQLKQLKIVLQRQGSGIKILPYSSEYEAALRDFSALTKKELTPRDFWVAICQSQNRSRRPPRRTAPRVAQEVDEDVE